LWLPPPKQYCVNSDHQCTYCLFVSYAVHRDLHSFPTRRSSDLIKIHSLHTALLGQVQLMQQTLQFTHARRSNAPLGGKAKGRPLDRKSTRLNSSHVKISYAVFCLKKKSKTTIAKHTLSISNPAT